MNGTARNSKQQGISLIELMVVMAVLAIMAAFALPGVESSVSTGHRAKGAMEAMGMLDHARSLAIDYRSPVSVCASSDQHSCNSDNWEDGWLVFIDDGAGGTARDGKRSGSEVLLQVGTGSSVDVTIRAHAFDDNGAILFDEVGMASHTGSLVVCDGAGDSASVLEVSDMGQSMHTNSSEFACS